MAVATVLCLVSLVILMIVAHWGNPVGKGITLKIKTNQHGASLLKTKGYEAILLLPNDLRVFFLYSLKMRAKM